MTQETKNVVVSAVVGGVVSLIVSVLTVGMTLYTDSIAQRKVAELQTVLAFTDRAQPLNDLAARYVAAITADESLSEIKVAIRGEIVQEIAAVERLRSIVGEDQRLIEDYQAALTEFSQALEDANSATKMRKWAEAFGRTNDARLALDMNIRQRVGV